MALDDIEKAAQYQALCADAFRDGGFRHAHNLRALARSINQLALEGEPVLSLSWDKRPAIDPDGPAEKAVRVVASNNWTRALNGVHMRPKMPGLNRATIDIVADITADARVYFQVETLRGGFDLAANQPAGRTFSLWGQGALTTYTLTGIPVHEGLFERFGFWVRGERTDELADEETFGAGNKSRVESITTTGYLTADAITGPGANWNYGPEEKTLAVAHAIVVGDGDDIDAQGDPIFEAQITDVIGPRVCSVFRPPATSGIGSSMRGHYFSIYKLPIMRIVAIDINLEDG